MYNQVNTVQCMYSHRIYPVYYTSNGIVSVDSKCSQASAECGRVEDKSRPGLFDLLSAEEGS